MDKVYVIRLNKDRTKTHIAVNLGAVLEDNSHIDNILLQEYDIVNVLSSLVAKTKKRHNYNSKAYKTDKFKTQ